MPVSTQRGSTGAGDLRQQGRFTRLSLPSGGDRLVLHRFSGSEALSGLFEFQVDALSQDNDFDLGSLLGRPATVSYRSHGGAERHFSGIVTSGERAGPVGILQSYRLVLRPWLWLLGRRVNSRVFKNKTIMQIIEFIFRDWGFSDFKFEVEFNFENEEYIVQYAESDLDFVSRLMEEWGIYYYFEHTDEKHVLHLTDAALQHPRIVLSRSDQSGDSDRSLLFRPREGQTRRDGQHLTAWRAERQVRTGRVELRDYDYLRPSASLTADYGGVETYQHASIEAYRYRGRWPANRNPKNGGRLSRVQLEAEQALDHRRFGIGDAVSLYPGGAFGLRDHPTDDGDYLVIAARHRFVSQDYRSGEGESGMDRPYEGDFEFQPNSRPFRAPQVTRRPRIFGPQTAMVTMGAGASTSEEIDVDEHGRILVNFHWNRHDPRDDCSRRVRVAQSWAGEGWGFQFIPRVGMEVVVEFLDGDPDQPLVTGAVYNDEFKHPYTLPEHKTQSGIKTRSTLNGSPNTFNELRFEDKKGQEEVYFRAEKDHNSLIQNKEKRTIATNFKDGHDAYSYLEEVMHGSMGLGIFDGHYLIKLVDGTMEILIEKGNLVTHLEKGNITTDVDAGGITATAADGITVTSATSITLQIKGGQTSIVLDPTGITLKGPMININ